MSSLIRTPDEITAGWLSDVLGRDVGSLGEVAGIGTGQMSRNYRVPFAEGSVVVKLASDDDTSRGTGLAMKLYYREVMLYRELAARLGDALPACSLADYEPNEGWFTLVLEDIVGATQGDQIAGCSVDEARVALEALASIHAPVVNDLALGLTDWLNVETPVNQGLLEALIGPFAERYGERLDPAQVELIKRFAGSYDAWLSDQRAPLGLVHGDFRLDNLLFGGGTCRVVDWQTVGWGPVMLDCSYFLGGALSLEDRRASEQELVRGYYDGLVARGVQNFAWEQCWDGYRRQAFAGMVMATIASMVVERTDRGDDMFMAMFSRAAQHALDLDSIELVPEPGAAPPPALVPAAVDEGRHAPGPEPLWNESWYFDAVSDDESLGVYVRTGRLPNLDRALFTACICGPGRPSIMLVGAEAPLPPADDEAQRIDVDGLHASQVCEEPLQRFRVAVAGVAGAFDDPAGPLRDEAGAPVEVSLDLVWETAGVPFQWRQATRYEIPCRVSGVVRIGDEEIAFAGPGQRDHSWGSRDWWATEWMWSALHLEDGTHTHAVGVPTMPGVGVGYVQRDGEVTEISVVSETRETADDGLITSGSITTGDLVTEVEPLAYGALRLVAPDGRVTHFPRAMCRVRAADGRVGSGWVEWNSPQR